MAMDNPGMRWALPLCCLLGSYPLVGCSVPPRAVEAPREPGRAPIRVAGSGTCDKPVPLVFGRSLLGSTADGAEQLSATCVRAGASESVYSFDLSQRAAVRIDVHSDVFDPALYLRGGCLQSRSEIACNDDYPRDQTHHSRIDTTLEPGRYFAVVDSAAGEAGEFELFARSSPVPAMVSACEGAPLLSSGQLVRGANRAAVNNFQATCANGARGAESVHRLRVEGASRVRVRQQTEYDGVLYLRQSCADPSTELACNDDFRDARHGLLTARVDAGDYFVFADSLSSRQKGTYALSADVVPVPTVPADPDRACAQAAATAVRSGAFEFDTIDASDQFAASCGGAGAPEAVFAVRAPSRVRIWAHLREPELNAVLYLRGQCADASSELACQRQVAVDRRPARSGSPPRGINLIVPKGDYALIADGATEADFGAGRLEIEARPVRELEALCSAAPLLSAGDVVQGDTAQGRDNFRAGCAAEAQSPDDVYRLRIVRAGMYRIHVTAGFDTALHLRRACADVASEIACNDDGPGRLTSRIETELAPGQYVLVVDGFGVERKGTYELSVEKLTGP